MFFQLHVADNIGTQRSGDVRESGAAEAGMKFFGDGRAAGLSAALQHQRLESGLRQVEGGDQSVMAATDDHDVALLLGQLRLPLEVFQNFESRQPPGRAHDAAAGMRGRSAHVEVLDRRAELRPSRHRPQEEELLQRELALEDVAFAQSELAFQIERRDYLAVQDDVFDIRRVLGNGVDHVVAKRFFLIVPVQAGPQLVRRVLHEARHDVLSRRRDRRIGQRGNDHVNVRRREKLPYLASS